MSTTPDVAAVRDAILHLRYAGTEIRVVDADREHAETLARAIVGAHEPAPSLDTMNSLATLQPSGRCRCATCTALRHILGMPAARTYAEDALAARGGGDTR